ncbi:MAG: hypothetical protein QM784_21305 [Polyangiaceae bacterium]
MQRLFLGAFFCLVAACARMSIAAEQSSPATAALSAAEGALQAVDFEAVQQAALAGLSTGEATPEETVRLHVLAGTAAAILGKDEGAKLHFIVALAIRPQLSMDGTLSPKARQPYLEAVGYWGDREERLQATTKVDTRRAQLAIRVVDPAAIVRRSILHIRAIGEPSFAPRSLESRSRVEVPISTRLLRSGFEYFVELVDEAGNRLFQIGTEDEPIVVQGGTVANSLGHSTPLEPITSAASRTSRAIPLGLLAGGLIATSAGVYFNVRREDEAAHWNGSSCERSGMSRLEQCGAVDRRRERFEWLSIGSYALGAGLIVSGAGWLLFDGSSKGVPERTQHAKTRVVCGIGNVGTVVVCSGGF